MAASIQPAMVAAAAAAAVGGGAGGGVPLAPTYPMASLYVGDLDPEVSEAMLFEKFSQAGPVLSIRVCRDAVSRRSLGYAYVNFQQPADAERALDTMNFDVLNGRPIRIMWSQRDPSSRRSGVGNIFIKNLDKSIDNKAIYDTFSTFGPISSCKVATDEQGNSKGYGFVHFDTEQAANTAVERVNGMLLQGKKVFVGPFMSRERRQREFGDSIKKFTNCYVKNFAEDIKNDEELKAMFDKFGTVLSAKVVTDVEGKSKGFGFVSFEKPEEAEAAVDEMNDKEMGENGERKLYVGRAQKRAERTAELRRKYEALKQEKMQKYVGVNLYVKNLDDDITDERLRERFSEFGEITSCKIMTDESGRSKGFGFVCFTYNEEATKAVTEMSGKLFEKKPLYVALAQRKEDRKAQLASQYMQRLASMRMANTGTGAMFAPTHTGFFTTPAAAGMARPAYVAQVAGFGNQTAAAAMRAAQTPRWAAAAPVPAYPRTMAPYQSLMAQQQQQQFYAQQQQQQQQQQRSAPRAAIMAQQQVQPLTNQRVQQQQQAAAAAAAAAQNRMQQGQVVSGQLGQGAGAKAGVVPAGRGAGPAPAGGPRPAPTGARYPGDYSAQYMVQQNRPVQQGPQALTVQGQPPITPAELANAPAQEQKQMLGERIYPLIEKTWSASMAGKITGMLLEMDNSELLMMLTDETLLRNKVEEAVSVLNAHQQTAAVGAPAGDEESARGQEQ